MPGQAMSENNLRDDPGRHPSITGPGTRRGAALQGGPVTVVEVGDRGATIAHGSRTCPSVNCSLHSASVRYRRKRHVQALDSWPARPECSGANQRAVAKRLVGQYRGRQAGGRRVVRDARASRTRLPPLLPPRRIDAGPAVRRRQGQPAAGTSNAPAGWPGTGGGHDREIHAMGRHGAATHPGRCAPLSGSVRRGGSGRRQSDPRRAETISPGRGT